ncbi:unnamed protein product [Symbiodinium sp. CCMP2592]|nr:unnamed protein product [Symbiodinium sp. CCMP2592]
MYRLPAPVWICTAAAVSTHHGTGTAGQLEDVVEVHQDNPVIAQDDTPVAFAWYGAVLSSLKTSCATLHAIVTVFDCKRLDMGSLKSPAPRKRRSLPICV